MQLVFFNVHCLPCLPSSKMFKVVSVKHKSSLRNSCVTPLPPVMSTLWVVWSKLSSLALNVENEIYTTAAENVSVLCFVWVLILSFTPIATKDCLLLF